MSGVLNGVSGVFCNLLPISWVCAAREFCVNQSCTVMHCPAIQGTGRLDNSLINKAQELDVAD